MFSKKSAAKKATVERVEKKSVKREARKRLRKDLADEFLPMLPEALFYGVGVLFLVAGYISAFLWFTGGSLSDRQEREAYEGATNEWSTTATHPVAALSTTDETSTHSEGKGWSILANGHYAERTTTEGVEKIRYVEVADDGGMNVKKLPIEDVTLYELKAGDAKPRIETISCKVMPSMAKDRERYAEKIARSDCGTRYALHVPAGSITTGDYNLDVTP